MRERLRKSGIDVVGDVPWGMHFCQFYQTKEDLLDIIVPYFKAGLEDNEFCLWVVSRPSEVERAKKALRRAVPDIDVYLEKGQIEIIPYTSWSVKEGSFDSVRVVNGWVEKLNQALENGYDGLRLGNSFRLEKNDWNDFTDYEEKIDDVIGNYQMISLCTYSLDRCNATEIVGMVINHQFALVKRDGKWKLVVSSRHKKAEEKIRNLASIVESSNDAIITESLDGIITSWNKGAEQIYGYSAKEIIGKPISILEPSILIEEIKELVELIEQGDKIHHYETLQLRKDGARINISLTLSPVFDISGKLTSISIIARDITRNKKVEEKLQKSEERYRIVTEHTGQVIYEYDLRTDKISWTGAIEEVTGYSFEEFQKLGTNVWIKNIQLADMNHVDEKSQNVRKIGGRYKEELRLIRKDGNYTYVENSGFWLTDQGGQPYRALGVLKDITGAKIADIQLQKSEERYRIAAEQTGQVVFDFKLETCEVEWAGAIREVTGYDPEELVNLGKSVWIEHVHAEDRAKMIKNMKNFFRKLEKIQAEFRFRKKDGNYIDIELRGVWLKDDDGKVYRAIGVLKDITEWKYAIEKIEASEKKYRSVIQNFQGIVFQADKNFIPVFLQGAVEEITGYSEEEFGSRVQWKDVIHPKDLSFVLKAEEKVRNAPSTGYGEIDFRLMRKDGKIRWVHEIYQKVQGKDEKPEYYQGTIYDVTERKETEKFLANIETARKKEIHHRIKNNLQVISSLLDLQAEKFNNRGCIKDSEILEAFKESQDRVISMALIHEELYKGGVLDTLNFSSYVKKLTKNLFQTYRLGNASTSLNMNLEENISLDMDTAIPLGIIINELVSNALKYAFADIDKGEIRITLCVEESRECKDNKARNNNEGLKGTSFILTVSDNGIGMSESFDLENPDGLGIQLITTLVDQLEGEIELKRDNGTEFTIRFTVV
jgi:PAS domain S-box-containing protein